MPPKDPSQVTGVVEEIPVVTPMVGCTMVVEEQVEGMTEGASG